ncbi:hypothetical protein BDB00DRAFT_789835 [Zychaea mexicana]|uniref:uncharacterized protein n=1 Tax=Zychaea mexicana TaxID=64656 RepID=UPI0022FECDA5|nr:uncharacterized protein BDB00DRAFT_789835 [Zychaea mexicana]KAI9491037.1 hypothetical protein BDB00DRAFT_789835 [Zychaea mexicana]
MTFGHHYVYLFILAVSTTMTSLMTDAMPLIGPEQQQVIRSSPPPSSSQAAAAASLLNQVLSTDSDEDAYFGPSWMTDEGEDEEGYDDDQSDMSDDDEDADDGVDYGFIFSIFGSDESSSKTEATSTSSAASVVVEQQQQTTFTAKKDYSSNKSDNSDDDDAVHQALLMVSSSDIDDNVIEMAILARTRQIFRSRQHRRITMSSVRSFTVDREDGEEEEELDYLSDT